MTCMQFTFLDQIRPCGSPLRGSTRAAGLIIGLLFAVQCAILSGQTEPPARAERPTPILIELFTSEGCSSCPPADAWLKSLDHTQPIPGARAIVLSEHVDYWNQDGWADPYSSALFTARQRAYVRAFRGSSPYTPEVVVNGVTELQLSAGAQLEKTLRGAAEALKFPVALGALRVDEAPNPALYAHVEIGSAANESSADVYAALALDRAESEVLHGENQGRRLEHAAVALSLVRIGKLEKGKTFSLDFKTPLKPGVDLKNLRLIVFVQQVGPGPVLGAAYKEAASATILKRDEKGDERSVTGQSPARSR
jgi:hypothetical protein